MAAPRALTCNKCVPLCGHVFRRKDSPDLHVQLHQDFEGRTHHLVLAVDASPPAFAGFGLSAYSTEGVADFYTCFIKYVESTGYSMARTQTAFDKTQVHLPGKKSDTSMDVLGLYFHLPISQASKVLGICSTSLKKICRKHGLDRWPHRKVKSIDRKVVRCAAVRLANMKTKRLRGYIRKS